MPTLPPGTPAIQLDEIERYNFPCVTLSAPLPGHTYNADGETPDACTVPVGAVLVDFHRDVALLWLSRHGDGYPCNVLFPDGRFVYMTVDTERVLEIVPRQDPMRWDVKTQRWERE